MRATQNALVEEPCRAWTGFTGGSAVEAMARVPSPIETTRQTWITKASPSLSGTAASTSGSISQDPSLTLRLTIGPGIDPFSQFPNAKEKS